MGEGEREREGESWREKKLTRKIQKPSSTFLLRGATSNWRVEFGGWTCNCRRQQDTSNKATKATTPFAIFDSTFPLAQKGNRIKTGDFGANEPRFDEIPRGYQRISRTGATARSPSHSFYTNSFFFQRFYYVMLHFCVSRDRELKR